MLFPTSLRLPRRLAGICLVAFLGLLLLPPAPLRAQAPQAGTFDATTLRRPTNLGMTWLLKAGDDPAYAQPDFDDSKWTVVDPNETLLRTFQKRPEIVWYRLHVKVAPNETGLALGEFYLDSAFEIYINGQKFMTTGTVSPFKPSTFDAYLIKRIPDADIATGSLVIALRVHISPSDWAAGFPGLYSYNLTMGQEGALSDSTWLTIIGLNSLGWFGTITGLGLGIVALSLFVAQSHQREYLWIFLLFLTGSIRLLLAFYRYFHNGPTEWLYLTLLFQVAGLVFLTRTYFALLRIHFGTWIRIVLGIVIACMLIGTVATATGTGSAFFNIVTFVPQSALLAGVIPVLLIVHLRRGNREAGILLVPAVFSALTIYFNIVFYVCTQVPAMARTVQRVQTAIFFPTVGPFTLDLNDLSNCLFVLSLAIIIVLRSTRMSRQQAFIESEMAAAREVQQIILPEQLERVPGFSIESAYVPAQQVGGDFFQILPAPEGSLFLVIGDVAGKGLPAAMLVSVLVGAIRGVAEYTSEPAELLANLNQRLVGRVAGSFSTALAARIFPNGNVVLSNAGHLPPYLDGQEVPVSGALPLGAKAGTHYETMRLQMPRGSRLTFYSDGIVEAQNTKGELFGFERSREISMNSVESIVQVAKQFGQMDDMTVIAITRDAAAVRDPQAQNVSVPAPALAN
jgi:phosphoserine phosphatase RsbU/P